MREELKKLREALEHSCLPRNSLPEITQTNYVANLPVETISHMVLYLTLPEFGCWRSTCTVECLLGKTRDPDIWEKLYKNKYSRFSRGYMPADIDWPNELRQYCTPRSYAFFASHVKCTPHVPGGVLECTGNLCFRFVP